jgi:O-antigen/teichoic acid export membrane protein
MIARLKSTLAHSDFVKNVAKLTAGTALAQALLVLASPLLSRLYTPADFGGFALYNSVVAVLLIISTGRYDIGIVSASNRKEAIGLFTLSSVLLLAFVALTMLVLLLFGDWLVAAFLDNEEAGRFLLLVPATVLFLGAYQILSYWSNREKEYSNIAVSKVAQNASNILTALAIGFFLSWGIGLILGHIVGALLAICFMLYRAKLPLKEVIGLNTKEDLKAYASKYKDFPRFSLPTAFIDTFTLQLPVFLIILLFDEAIAGHFSFAYRILSVPIALIGASMGQVFYQKLTELTLDKKDPRKLILKTWGSLAMIGVVPFSILLLFGEALFRLVFGQEWALAGNMASILAIPLFFMFCSAPTSTAFIVFGIQKYSLIFGIIAIVLRPLAFYIGYIYHNVFIGLIFWGIFDVCQILLYNALILKKSRNGLS